MNLNICIVYLISRFQRAHITFPVTILTYIVCFVKPAVPVLCGNRQTNNHIVSHRFVLFSVTVDAVSHGLL